MKLFLTGAVAMAALFLLASFAVRTMPQPPALKPNAQAVTPLRLADLTLDKAFRVQITPPYTLTVPAQTAFVLTEAVAGPNPGGGSQGYVYVNGFLRAHFWDLRRFEVPIIARAGDVVSLTGTTPPIEIGLAGYTVADSDVSGGPPTAPMPLALRDVTLDRALHFGSFVYTGGHWSLTLPPAATFSIAIVEWFGSTTGTITLEIDGILTSTNAPIAVTGEPLIFNPPIVLHPGQTLTATNNGASFEIELGAYIVYPGEV